VRLSCSTLSCRSEDGSMPHLDAMALDSDPDGCAFLRSVLGPARPAPRSSEFLCAPALPPSSLVAHLGRELRSAYAGLMSEGVPEHLADLVGRFEAATAKNAG
jgi:hypothetical protein